MWAFLVWDYNCLFSWMFVWSWSTVAIYSFDLQAPWSYIPGLERVPSGCQLAISWSSVSFDCRRDHSFPFVGLRLFMVEYMDDIQNEVAIIWLYQIKNGLYGL
jgi:hypothetical protein